MAVASKSLNPERRRASAAAAAILLGSLSAGAAFSLGTSTSRSAPTRVAARSETLSEHSPRSHSDRSAAASSGTTAAAGLAAGAVASCWALGARAQRRSAAARRKSQKARLQALPEHADLIQRAQEALQASPELQQLTSHLGEWVNNLVANGLVPPAFADATAAPEVAAAVASAVPPLPEGVTLEEGVAYLKDATGAILIDPYNNQPLKDDWWNGFVGIQSEAIKAIDQQLRGAGVPQAFGWSIVVYTLIIKVLFFPLQQDQLRSTTMMQMMQPKVKEIQTKYAGDQETQTRLLSNLYASMDVNPLGGCVPILVTLPLYWALFSVWRRLAVEKYPYYSEGWLWVPSLAQPNPDFQFKYDWLFQFKDGAPDMGWESYGAYLIFPAILVGTTIIQQQQAQAAQSSKSPTPGADPAAEEAQSILLKVLPIISVYFIGSLALTLPQAVSVYYAVNTGITLAQTQFVKLGLRSEIPGYEEFERTGKFPDSTLEDMAAANMNSKTLHEAVMNGDISGIKRLLDEPGEDGKTADIDGYDEKNISPIGYAVAVGNIRATKLLMERGADMKKLDGQGNSLLHYAAGYGKLDVLEELLKTDAWPNQEWKDLKNNKGQTPLDAARVNKKKPVIDFLREELGLPPDVEVVEAKPAEPAEAKTAQVVDATPAAAPAAAAPAAAAPAPAAAADAEEAEKMAKARAALMAAAGGGAAAQPGAAAGAAPSQADTAAAMKAAVAKLRSNPEALEQARKMMDSMPPGMMSMMTGGKMNEEQAKKAMEAMKGMNTEDLLSKAESVMDKIPAGAMPPAAAEAAKAAAAVNAAPSKGVGQAPTEVAAGGKSARAVD